MREVQECCSQHNMHCTQRRHRLSRNSGGTSLSRAVYLSRLRIEPRQ
jgi:hypothetical protein